MGPPLAFVVIDIGLAVDTTWLGWVLAGLGFAWWMGAIVWERLPWEIRRKPRAMRGNVPPAAEPEAATPSWEALNDARERRYEENDGHCSSSTPGAPLTARARSRTLKSVFGSTPTDSLAGEREVHAGRSKPEATVSHTKSPGQTRSGRLDPIPREAVQVTPYGRVRTREQ